MEVLKCYLLERGLCAGYKEIVVFVYIVDVFVVEWVDVGFRDSGGVEGDNRVVVVDFKVFYGKLVSGRYGVEAVS